MNNNKLEDIGFYTLSDKRAKQTSINSPLWRCELILTDKCNFKCEYCRGLRKDIKGEIPFQEALKVVSLWCQDGLKNIRFSGGEPTLYKGLIDLVEYCKKHGVENIAISTNGSGKWSMYQKLIDSGVTDFSVSLDACCSSMGDKMAGGIKGAWNHLTENIKRMTKQVYTTVGVVINEDNIDSCIDTIKYASSLDVNDIRIVPSAQYNKLLDVTKTLPKKILDKYPILKYRINHINEKINVRGIKKTDCNKCHLAIDDMAVANGYHFPCIIYMREQGDPIGKVSSNMRKERLEWIQNHDSYKDKICRKNCLDVCIDYNNKVRDLQNGN